MPDRKEGPNNWAGWADFFSFTVVRPTSESEGVNLVHFIHYHYPLNTKPKLPAADNFSLKQRVSTTSTLVNFNLKV